MSGTDAPDASVPDLGFEPGFDPLLDAPTGPRPVRDLPRALRPREKLENRGVESLSRTELLALILGTGTKGEPASATADRLLRRHGLKGLASLRPRELRAERGIGAAAAARLCAAFELGRRSRPGGEEPERPRLVRPKDVWDRVREITRAKKEHLVGLYLDAQNGLIHKETLSVGALNTTRTHPREILYPAVVHLALGFILVHNHPSGVLDPSEEDLGFTQAVRRAGELMGIDLYDHVIVTAAGYTSLRERGMM